MDDFITIGGEKRQVKLTFRDVSILKNLFNLYAKRNRDMLNKGKIFDWNKFYFECVWRSLGRKGFLFWKKPFRSKVHFEKSVLYPHEYNEIQYFIQNRIIEFEDVEDKEQKNVVPAKKAG